VIACVTVRRATDDLPTLKEKIQPIAVLNPVGLEPGEPEPPSVRRQTLGRYRLLFPIARGGMGTVHAAVLKGEAGVGRTFAIKVLRSQDRGPEEVAALVSEARLTTMISHPNVLETFELGMVGGEPFIVMPLVKGVTLAKLAAHFAAQHAPFPSRLAAWIGAEVAAGLHAAHDATNIDGQPLGVVHRDVSPQNVLLTFDGRVLLLDFGVAKFFEATQATVSGVVKGKFGYMSPEQLRCEPLDRRSDVFALGVVLFELCTGRPLYANLPPAAATLEIIRDSVPRLREHFPEAPPDLDRALFRAMAKSRNERFADAAELRDALRSFLQLDRGQDVDLGELLRTTFADAKRDLDEKIRASLRSANGPEDVGSEAAKSMNALADPLAPASTRQSAVAAGALDKKSTSRSAAVMAGVAILAIAGASSWALSRDPTAQAPAVPSAAPITATSLAAPLSAPGLSTLPIPEVSGQSSSPVSENSAGSTPSGPPVRRAPPPRVSAPASASQTPTASVGGTPFRDL